MKDKTYHRGTRVVGLIAICLPILAYASTSNAQVYVERSKSPDPITRTFDAPKNETTVAVIPDFVATLAGSLLTNSAGESPSSTKVDFHLRVVSYSYAGNVPARPSTVNFVFISDGRKPKFKDVPEFRVEADGSEIIRGKTEYSLKDLSDGPLEVLTIPFSNDVFQRVARAAKVQFSFGSKTYKLSNSQRKDIRALADTIP